MLGHATALKRWEALEDGLDALDSGFVNALGAAWLASCKYKPVRAGAAWNM